MSRDVTRILREAYDRRVDDRDARSARVWEIGARDAFIALIRGEHKRSLLELGAATGSDALAFEAHGLDVVCVDLSLEMVRRCQTKGLTAHVMDVSDLRFPRSSFDAVYAMNCLVHIPRALLPEALLGVSQTLRPDGLFYLGLYGGLDFEGIWDGDDYEPKRFFSHYPDEELRGIVTTVFDLHSFRQIPRGWNGLHFQSLVLRRPPR